MQTQKPAPLPMPSYRDRFKRRQVIASTPPFENETMVVHEKTPSVKLRRRRAQQTLSFYDNHQEDEHEFIVSKWTIVRQRLPDILAMSQTYKPTSMRAQLVLLIALMNKQSQDTAGQMQSLSSNHYNSTISHIVPANVLIDNAGRSQWVCLKGIPSDQVIHVDVDGLTLSIPTRQFLLAISRGYAQDSAAKYCPPAISEMLIDLSKTKIIDDRKQFKRAQLKMRLGQSVFFLIFILIHAMVLALIMSVADAIFQFDSKNYTIPRIPMTFGGKPSRISNSLHDVQEY